MNWCDLHEIGSCSHDRYYLLHSGAQISEIRDQRSFNGRCYFLKSYWKPGKISRGCGFQRNFNIVPDTKWQVGTFEQ